MFTETNTRYVTKTSSEALYRNRTDNLKEMTTNSSSQAVRSHGNQDLEKYLVPSLMSCPLIASMYVIYKLYKRVKQLSSRNTYTDLPMMRLEPFETDL